jgi:hypothetical protein
MAAGIGRERLIPLVMGSFGTIDAQMGRLAGLPMSITARRFQKDCNLIICAETGFV